MPHRLLGVLLERLTEGGDPWQKLALDLLHGRSIDRSFLADRVREALDAPLRSKDDADQFYRRYLLFFAIAQENSIQIDWKAFQRKAELQGFGSTHPLGVAYQKALGQNPSSADAPFWASGPDLLKGLEITLVSLLADLKREGGDFSLFFKQVHLFDELLDSRGRLIGPVWIRQDAYLPSSLFIGQALLFCSAAKLCGSAKYHLVAESSLAHLQKFDKWETLPFEWITLIVLISASFEHASPSLAEPAALENLPLYRFGKLRALLTLVGSETGLGVISKGSVRVVSMGPSAEPAGESAVFGVDYQVGGLGYESKGVVCEVSEESMQFSGWTKSRQGSWFEFNATAHRGRLTLGCRLEEKLNFLLYVQAKRVVISESIGIERASFHRYKGPASSIAFVSDEETLSWFPEKEGEVVEVIPLAGGRYFWGGDFLVICSASTRMTLV